jgi:Icc-related predicted phosphoesterase
MFQPLTSILSYIRMGDIHFQLVSDLHVDCRTKVNPYYQLPEWRIKLQRFVIQPNKDSEEPADILIVAGDTCEGHDNLWNECLGFLADYYEFVIVIAGNHEYYNTSRKKVKENTTKLPGNCHYLDCSTIDVGGVVIAGATLWFNNGGYTIKQRERMGDFKAIPCIDDWLQDEHIKHVNFFSTVEADVWMMHHLPHPRSIDPRFANDPLNCFFMKDISPVIEQRQPQVIVHGHTHSSCDYMVGETRIICNPLGYPGEKKTHYPLCQFTLSAVHNDD